MNNCKLLNFPKNVLKSNFELISEEDEYWHIGTNVSEIINDEILEILKSLNLHPNMVLLNKSKNDNRSFDKMLIHTDFYKKNGTFVKPACGINYELGLGEIETDIYWFNTESCERIPFNPFTLYNNILFYPQTYTQNDEGYPIGAKLIENVKLNNTSYPILFRTDLAHGVSYKSTQSPRFMLSIRFDIDEIDSWEKALSIFSDYIT